MDIILHIPESELGPEMRALVPKQRAFVYALVETGGNPTQAAAAAGYGEDCPTLEKKQAACRAAGYTLAHHPKVLRAIKEEASKRLHSGALIAASALIEIVNDVSHKNRLRAVEVLLDRAGLVVEQRSVIDVNHNHRADGEQVERIRQLAGNLGLDPRKLLGHAGVVVDAEFEEVGSSAGLEDLL